MRQGTIYYYEWINPLFLRPNIKHKIIDWKQIHAAVVDATAPETAAAIFNQLEQDIEPVEIVRAGLSPVVGRHAGPGAFGVTLLDTSSLQHQEQ